MVNEAEMNDAQILWEYHKKLDSIEKIQDTVIVGLGSYDLRVARYCANLYLQGYGEKIIFTGKSGNWTHNRWEKTEAEVFAAEARHLGISEERILLEKEATNLGENICNVRNLIEKLSIPVKQIILVTKPNTTRRAYATFKNNWPEIPLIVSAPDFPLTSLPADRVFSDLINEMVGDIERIIFYPDKGFQIPQEIPQFVMDAYDRLKASGYIEHCLPRREYSFR